MTKTIRLGKSTNARIEIENWKIIILQKFDQAQYAYSFVIIYNTY